MVTEIYTLTLRAKEVNMHKPGELLKFQIARLGDKHARCTMLVKEEWQ